MATFQDEVVLVSGSNGALGAAVVARLTASGRRVVALERSRPGDEELQRESESLVRLRTNLGEPSALLGSLRRAEAETGALTAAVLTAGAWRGGHKFYEAEAEADYRTVMDANLQSAQVVLRSILPGLVARRRGSVVLVGSRSGVRPYDAANDAAYAAAKAALTALGQAIAAEVLADGVRVNLVLPSTLDTEANRRAMPGADPSRWVTTDSLSDVIEFLLSDKSRDISGVALPVYGRVNV